MTLICNVPLFGPAAQPLLPISHQPKQNQAEGGTKKIKVNPTQLSDQMDYPVLQVVGLGKSLQPRYNLRPHDLGTATLKTIFSEEEEFTKEGTLGLLDVTM